MCLENSQIHTLRMLRKCGRKCTNLVNVLRICANVVRMLPESSANNLRMVCECGANSVRIMSNTV